MRSYLSVWKKTLILLLLSATICMGTNAQEGEIGIELYSFRNQLAKDVPGTLQKIRKMGFTVVEGSSSYAGLQPEEFKGMLDQAGLRMISIGVDFNELVENPEGVAKKAKLFGAQFVVCFWIPHEEDKFTLDDAKKAIDVFNHSGRILKEKGLYLCYHPHGYEFVPYNDGTLFDYLVEQLLPEFCNFEMDVFWIQHPGQDPVELLKKYPTRFLLMHLKDRERGTPGNQSGRADVETNVALGKGDIDIKAIMQEARKHNNVKHYFIEDESSRSEDQVPKSLAYLRKL